MVVYIRCAEFGAHKKAGILYGDARFAFEARRGEPRGQEGLV
jgi:hypothetical protein